MKNNNLYKSQFVQSLSSKLFLIAIFALAAFTAQAQIVTTTIETSDPNGAAAGLVTVFDAQTGRQIASGATGATNNRFRFQSGSEQQFVIVVLTAVDSLYQIGTARGAAGSTISVTANQSEFDVPGICYETENVILSYTNASGAPLKNARISIVDRNTFANVRRAKTNQQGQYNFNLSAFYGSGFVAAVWKGDSAIQLTRVTPGCSF